MSTTSYIFPFSKGCKRVASLSNENAAILAAMFDWHLRTKFGDDTTALEIIPRNSISLLNVVASDINNFAISHNMKLTLYYQQIKSVSISRGINYLTL